MKGIDVVTWYIGSGINPTLQKLQTHANSSIMANSKGKGKKKQDTNTEEEDSAIKRHSPEPGDSPEPQNIQIYQSHQDQGEAGPSIKRARPSEPQSSEAPIAKRSKSIASYTQQKFHQLPKFNKIQPKGAPKVLVPDSEEETMDGSSADNTDVHMHRATPSPPPGSPSPM